MVMLLGINLYDKGHKSSVKKIVKEAGADNHNIKLVSATGAHGLVTAKKNGEFNNILSKFYLNLPDGMPCVWVGRLKGAKKMTRCYGPDFFRDVITMSANKKINHFLCGGKPGIARELKGVCYKKFNNGNIVGIFSPPFRAMTDKEILKLCQKINSVKTDIVWIGLGTPKQEYFAEKLSHFVNVKFIITVGAAFDFHTGKVKQAPKIIQNIGMEWFFRLCMEPKRLWKRYFSIVPLFIFYATFDLLRRKKDTKHWVPDLGGTAPLSASKTAKKLSDFVIDTLKETRRGKKFNSYLDIGCGNGFITEHISSYFDETIGIDILDSSLNEFRKRCSRDKKIRIIKMSASNMSFPDKHFSLVTALEVLEHVEDLKKTICEVARVTKRGGLVCISTPHVLFPFENHGIKIGNKIIRKKILLLPYMPILHRRISLARVFSSRQLDQFFIKEKMEVVGKPEYMAPQFERNSINGKTWENKLRFTSNILGKTERLPILKQLTGVSMLKVYRKL